MTKDREMVPKRVARYPTFSDRELKRSMAVIDPRFRQRCPPPQVSHSGLFLKRKMSGSMKIVARRTP
jgi:hypothetical protein